MESAGISAAKPGGLLESRTFRLILLRRIRLRREGSLAAALTQSMALAVTGTAGAYPSWVLVKDRETQVVLGAAWAITRADPAPGAPLLGSAGAPLMLAIACCCLFSVLTGSLALTMDFLGRRRCRLLAPLLHGLTAFLTACAAAMGSCLLALVRGRIHTEPELRPRGFSTSPGQSLFLAFLACALASTATGLSCTSPARVEPARSSWDFRGCDRPPGFSPYAAAASSRATATNSSDSSRAAAAASRQSRRPSAAGSSFESERSGRVHWPDREIQDTPEDGLRRKGQQPEEEPPPAGGKGAFERNWASSLSLLGSFGSLFQLRGREAAEPQRAENSGPATEQETETEEEADLSRPADP